MDHTPYLYNNIHLYLPLYILHRYFIAFRSDAHVQPPPSRRDRKQSFIPLARRHVYVRQRPYTMTAEYIIIIIIIFVVIILT